MINLYLILTTNFAVCSITCITVTVFPNTLKCICFFTGTKNHLPNTIAHLETALDLATTKMFSRSFKSQNELRLTILTLILTKISLTTV